MNDPKSHPGDGGPKDKDNKGQQKKDGKQDNDHTAGAGLPPYPPD